MQGDSRPPPPNHVPRVPRTCRRWGTRHPARRRPCQARAPPSQRPRRAVAGGGGTRSAGSRPCPCGGNGTPGDDTNRVVSGLVAGCRDEGHGDGDAGDGDAGDDAGLDAEPHGAGTFIAPNPRWGPHPAPPGHPGPHASSGWGGTAQTLGAQSWEGRGLTHPPECLGFPCWFGGGRECPFVPPTSTPRTAGPRWWRQGGGWTTGFVPRVGSRL